MTSSTPSPPFSSRFNAQRLRRSAEAVGLPRVRRSKVPFGVFIQSLVLHALRPSGSCGHHLRTLSGMKLSDAAAQEQRSQLCWAWFDHLFSKALSPLASPKKHPHSFYAGMRLLAVDGSQWSLPNSESNVKALPRHGNQKGAVAAFPKFMTAVLVELGTHQPLAAACEQAEGGKASAEITLAKQLLGELPAKGKSLLLAGRLYGGIGFISAVLGQKGRSSEVLIRVADHKKARIIQPHSDGSAEVEVTADKAPKGSAPLRLREIRVSMKREDDEEGSELRLWTSLLDAQAHPAIELAKLYAQRWEAEGFFRELKANLGRENLLRATSLQGVQAEFGALIMAASLIAEQRLDVAAEAELPPLRMSLVKIGETLTNLVTLLAIGRGVLTEEQERKFIVKCREHLAREAVIKPRRSRSCQRGLRRPASAWTRIQQRSNAQGDWSYTSINVQ